MKIATESVSPVDEKIKEIALKWKREEGNQPLEDILKKSLADFKKFSEESISVTMGHILKVLDDAVKESNYLRTSKVKELRDAVSESVEILEKQYADK